MTNSVTKRTIFPHEGISEYFSWRMYNFKKFLGNVLVIEFNFERGELVYSHSWYKKLHSFHIHVTPAFQEHALVS